MRLVDQMACRAADRAGSGVCVGLAASAMRTSSIAHLCVTHPLHHPGCLFACSELHLRVLLKFG